MTKTSFIFSTFIAAVSITAEADQVKEALDSIYDTASKHEQLQTKIKNESATLALKNAESMSLGLKSLMHADAIKDRLARPEFYINDAKAEFLSIRIKDLKQLLSSIEVLLKSDDCVTSKCIDVAQYYHEKNKEIKSLEKQANALRGE